MNIIVEKLKKEDLIEAISIYDNNHDITTDYKRLKRVYSEICENPMYHNVVAKVDGKIVGFALVILNYDIVDRLKPFLTVWNFGVAKEWRRKGIGMKMFEYIDSFSKSKNCDFISLIAEKDNVIAQSFYEKIGYSKEVGYVKFMNRN